MPVHTIRNEARFRMSFTLKFLRGAHKYEKALARSFSSRRALLLYRRNHARAVQTLRTSPVCMCTAALLLAMNHRRFFFSETDEKNVFFKQNGNSSFFAVTYSNYPIIILKLTGKSEKKSAENNLQNIIIKNNINKTRTKG